MEKDILLSALGGSAVRQFFMGPFSATIQTTVFEGGR